jgi:CRP-like cAMP-binding protein
MAKAVTEEQAIELLAQTQECSRYFRDFDFQQLLDLGNEMTILDFKEKETVLFQGEPASFFAVILQGSLYPAVGDEQKGPARGVGDIIGEMSLFAGGTRNVSIVAARDGYLAVFSFSQLERLKESNPTLAHKLNTQLATAALEKRVEEQAGAGYRLTPHERESGIRELLEKQASACIAI